MAVRKLRDSSGDDDKPQADISTSEVTLTGSEGRHDVEAAVEIVDYSNHRIFMVLGWILWVVIVVANAYAIISLALGEDT